jgi:hypothetical protein
MRVGRRPRKPRTTFGEFDPVSESKFSDADVEASTANITADDCAWIGDNRKLNPDKLLKKREYELESPLRLILGAIIDACTDTLRRSRARRIDDAEAVLLGRKRPRGNDCHDDEDILRELGRRYFKKWLENPNREIEVAPIAREILAEARAGGRIPDVIVKDDFRRLQRKFIADRDRILARATVELKWDLPEFHDRILRILGELRALGVACDSRRIIGRIDPKHAIPTN